jgi:hypothetical protein
MSAQTGKYFRQKKIFRQKKKKKIRQLRPVTIFGKEADLIALSQSERLQAPGKLRYAGGSLAVG